MPTRVARGIFFSSFELVINLSFVLRHFNLEFWDAPFFYPC